MKKLAIALVTGATAIMAAAPSFAAIKDIRTWQHNLFEEVYSVMNLNAYWVHGDLRATTAAIGNNLTVNEENLTIQYFQQIQRLDVGAILNADIHGVGGDVSLTTVAICNNASTTVKNSTGGTWIFADQKCNPIDPFAISNVNLGNVGGDVTLTTVAIGNNFTTDVQADTSINYAWQFNSSETNAAVNATISNVAGDVTVTAAAIGNNASFTGTNN